ncbi:MAG: NAD(P)H-hydrate dehydratase [Chitinophagales bacterium]
MQKLAKILTVEQVRACDKHSMAKSNISSIELMEKASLAFVEAIEKEKLSNKKILVLCGPGNNGGDGLAVCRILQNKGYAADAVLVQFKEKLSPACEKNLERLESCKIIGSSSELSYLEEYELLIDALLGTGLSKKVEGFLAQVIEKINQAKKTVYSVDIPSGLASDTLLADAKAIKADLCISFQRPKLAFFFPENEEFIQAWKVVDIGLDEAFIQQQDTTNFVLDKAIEEELKARNKFSHKGSFGHALILAGSYGKIGAAVLATRACLRSGAGLVSAYVPSCAYQIMQSAAPESMCLTDENEKFLSSCPDLQAYSALGIGPGIGTENSTLQFLEKLLSACQVPLVLDADALNLLAKKPELLTRLPENSILTPHPKEFARLVGEAANSIVSLEKQRAFALKHKCIIIVKGANTRVCCSEGNIYFNTTGNPGMASGGSGDVLSGIICGLLAQGYAPLEASLLGVYFHGLAGDKAAEKKGETAMIASDIIENLRIEKT